MNKQKKEQQRIYLDNSASTHVDERVVTAMNPYWREHIGNAGSIHQEGVFAKRAIEEARSVVAHALHAVPNNIIFTSCGTESNNLAIFGTVYRLLQSGKNIRDIHLITSFVEHNSIFDCYVTLQKEGAQVTFLSVDAEGRIRLDELENAITEQTVLISTILVNNEIGTIEHIKDITQFVRRLRKKSIDTASYPLVHTDASQAFAWMSLNVQKMGVDLMTLDSQKIHGPKGMGCLFTKEVELLAPMLYGGGQEFGLRPGTPPTPLIVGFAKAISIVEEERDEYVPRVMVMRDRLIASVQKAIPSVLVRGSLGGDRIAGNISFSFLHIDGEQLVIELDARGIAVSTKSACLSGDSGESRVIQALCTPEDKEKRGTIRISMSRFTTEEEVTYAEAVLIETVMRLQGKKH